MEASPNEITPESRFFLEPSHPRQRQYEALRAFFVERVPSTEAARRFGYDVGGFRVLCWRFRHEMDRKVDVPENWTWARARKDGVTVPTRLVRVGGDLVLRLEVAPRPGEARIRVRGGPY